MYVNVLVCNIRTPCNGSTHIFNLWKALIQGQREVRFSIFSMSIYIASRKYPSREVYILEIGDFGAFCDNGIKIRDTTAESMGFLLQ